MTETFKYQQINIQMITQENTH